MKAAAPEGPFPASRDQVLDALRRHAGGEDAVERARVAALLEVAQDRLPHVEELAALLLEERAHEGRRVEGVRVLVADQEPEPLAVAGSRSMSICRSRCRSARVTPSSCM